MAGPAATVAEAEDMLSKHSSDVALVDVHLRGGEQSSEDDDRHTLLIQSCSQLAGSPTADRETRPTADSQRRVKDVTLSRWFPSAWEGFHPC